MVVESRKSFIVVVPVGVVIELGLKPSANNISDMSGLLLEKGERKEKPNSLKGPKPPKFASS